MHVIFDNKNQLFMNLIPSLTEKIKILENEIIKN